MRILWSAIALTVLGSVPLLAQHYARTDLTANSASVSDKAANIDGNLLNAWGLSRATTSPWVDFRQRRRGFDSLRRCWRASTDHHTSTLGCHHTASPLRQLVGCRNGKRGKDLNSNRHGL